MQSARLATQTANPHGTAALSIAGQSAQHLSGFAITLLAAGFLSAAEYGIYTVSVVFVECVVMLTYTGFYHFVVTSDAEDHAVLPTMFWVMVAIGTLGGGAMIAGAEPIAHFFDTPDLAPVLRLLGAMQPFASGIGWAAAQLTRAGLMRRYFTILIAANILALLAGGVLLVAWQSLYALVVYRAVRICISLALFACAVPSLPRLRFDWPLFRQAARYAAGLYGARSLTFFSTFGADLVLAYLFTTAEAGLYRFANRLATAAVDVVAQPLRHFSLKSFGQAARARRSLTPVFWAFFLSTAFLVGGFCVTVVVLGPDVIATVFRAEYLLASGAVQALAIRAAARVGQNMIEPSFSATKRTEIAFYHNLALSIAMLLVIFGAAPWGVSSLAWAQAGLQLGSIPFSLWVLRRYAAIDLSGLFTRISHVIGLLILYGLFLWGLTRLMSTSELSAGVSLAINLALALFLGGATTFLALRSGLLTTAIFSERETPDANPNRSRV